VLAALAGAPGGVAPDAGPAGLAGPEGGGAFDGARGTAVGPGRSVGFGRLLAGIFSRSGGLAATGGRRAASLLSGTGAVAGELACVAGLG
jgi:hypothetical protein